MSVLVSCATSFSTDSGHLNWLDLNNRPLMALVLIRRFSDRPLCVLTRPRWSIHPPAGHNRQRRSLSL